MGVQNKKPGASIADMVGLTMETIVGGVNDEEVKFWRHCTWPSLRTTNWLSRVTTATC